MSEKRTERRGAFSKDGKNMDLDKPLHIRLKIIYGMPCI